MPPATVGREHATLAEAMVACDGFAEPVSSHCDAAPDGPGGDAPGSGCVCHGVTLQGGHYQIRASKTVTPFADNHEKSWLRTEQRCGQPWGASFLLLLGISAVGYAVGGRLYSRRLGREGWPHAAQLHELRALVEDGVAFARAGRRRPGYRPLPRDAAGQLHGGGGSESRQGEKEESSSPKKRGKKGKRSKEPRHGAGGDGAGGDGAGAVALGVGGGGTGREVGAGAAGEAAPSADAGTAAAGGGRWVHVPT